MIQKLLKSCIVVALTLGVLTGGSNLQLALGDDLTSHTLDERFFIDQEEHGYFVYADEQQNISLRGYLPEPVKTDVLTRRSYSPYALRTWCSKKNLTTQPISNRRYRDEEKSASAKIRACEMLPQKKPVAGTKNHQLTFKVFVFDCDITSLPPAQATAADPFLMIFRQSNRPQKKPGEKRPTFWFDSELAEVDAVHGRILASGLAVTVQVTDQTTAQADTDSQPSVLVTYPVHSTASDSPTTVPISLSLAKVGFHIVVGVRKGLFSEVIHSENLAHSLRASLDSLAGDSVAEDSVAGTNVTRTKTASAHDVGLGHMIQDIGMWLGCDYKTIIERSQVSLGLPASRMPPGFL